MIDRKLRMIALGLLASTAISAPAVAQDQVEPPVDTTDSPAPNTNATDVTSQPPQVQVAQDGEVADHNEVLVTAQKREENLQDVPLSIQAIGTRRLDQLNISDFADYTKQLPSVSWNTSQSGGAVVYMRGVATGGDGNHSGSFPSVGVYLDEQPVTTIGGALDVHIYDIARIESLAGPQGTLYGASSEAGTIRIITNKPDLTATYGRVDAELNTVAHGGQGGSLEGMLNVPIAENIGFRGVAFYQRDAGFIDNVPGTRTYCGTAITDEDDETIGCVRDGFSVDNNAFVEDDFNGRRVYGGRAALKIDLDENWTITPTIMHQNMKQDGFYAVDPTLGDLEIQRFRGDEVIRDKFTQAALTIEGKLFNFDVTYAGAYMDRPTSSVLDYTDYTDAYDAAYESLGGLANYFYYEDSDGNDINPLQYIIGTEHFKKMSHELRIATPQDRPFRLLAGAFYQRQTNHIYQNYKIDGLAPELSVNGYPGTIWLTLEDRKDKDWALFGEASFDVTPQVTITAGGRLYRFDNSLFGFAGFGKNPAFGEADGAGFPPPPNGAGGSSGVRRCLTVNGEQLLDDEGAEFASGSIAGIPCTNVGTVVNGVAEPLHRKGSGFLHRLNASYKPNERMMFYATWSRGFRPGGLNRQPGEPPYDPDFLTNYELGWKTEFGPLRWNGAVYHQRWKKFQFSFLGANSLTVIHNGRDAHINGAETELSYVAGGLTLNGSAAYTDAKTKGNICEVSTDDEQCSATFIVTPSGTRLPITPKFKAAATARYSWPISIGKAHVQASVTHRSSAAVDLRQDLDGDGTNPNDYLGRIRSSTLVDLFAGFDWANYSAELFVSNLFDQRNELTRFVACSACTQTRIVPGRPRTIGIRLGAHF
ncbi:MAG TPA: TonB-dependent receptor [Sphingomicrobium sp.]|nr:TonB-dependent receptor [Sphingomicrobium sp.]